MSGSATREPAYDDDSTGDEFDQGKTDFWEEFRAYFGCEAGCRRPRLVTQPARRLWRTDGQAWPTAAKPAPQIDSNLVPVSIYRYLPTKHFRRRNEAAIFRRAIGRGLRAEVLDFDLKRPLTI